MLSSRNDYPYIGVDSVLKYKIPFLTEVFCFVDMSKTIGRVISAMDWHPVLSGLVVVAYSFTTSTTTVSRKYSLTDVFNLISPTKSTIDSERQNRQYSTIRYGTEYRHDVEF